MREIYFLLPADAAAWSHGQVNQIAEFSEAHRAPDGMGWTDCYIRPPAPLELAALRLTREEVAAAVAPYFQPFDRVHTGYSSYREECHNVMGWGTGTDCEIFASLNADGIVTAIWTNFFDTGDEILPNVAGAIAALGRLRPLVYVDWAWGYTSGTAENEFVAPLIAKVAEIRRRYDEHEESREIEDA